MGKSAVLAVVAFVIVLLTADPGLAAEPSTGEFQRERTSVTLDFARDTDAGLTAFRAVVAPPQATGTVQFTFDGKDLGPPVPVDDGIAESEPVALSLGRFHSVEADYSGDASFEPSRDEMENIKAIGDNPKDPDSGPPGFQPSGLFIALMALLALAVLAGAGLAYRKNKASAGAEG